MIGCVSYLNARPLIHGVAEDRLVLEVPSKLATRFAAGGLAAALLPVFEIFRMGEAFLAEDISISCRGAVKSVFLASPGPLEDFPQVTADPASITSNALTTVLLAEFFPGGPVLVPGAQSPARVIIGDQALDFRRTHPDWQILDLGEFWMNKTGLPFVFAAWCLSEPALAPWLRERKHAGLASIPDIAIGTPNPEESLEYLTKFIRYDLGTPEKAGLFHFAELAVRHGLLPAMPKLNFV